MKTVLAGVKAIVLEAGLNGIILLRLKCYGTRALKSDFDFRRNGRVHLNRRGRHFSRLLAAELCASAVVMVVILDTPCSVVV